MDRPLRVLQVIDSLARAGAEQSLATLAPYLVKEGIDLHIAYLVERDGLRDEIERAGVPVVSLAGGDGRRRAWLARTTDLLGELQPAIVHTTLFEADLAGRRAAARRGVPCVSSFVNSVYGRTESEHDGLHRLKLRGAQLADAVTARRVARFHAVTRYVAEVMSRRLLVPMSKIEVIPRGRDATALGRRSPERTAEVRRRLGLAADVPLVVAVGRQEPQKGLDVLLQALPAVRQRHPDVRVLVAGREGRATPALRQLAAATGVADTVSYLGMRDDVADLLAAADVLAFPSRWEGAGGTLIEAMALECPIVTARLPTLLETVDETTAELVTPGSPDDLSRGLLAVLDDRQTAADRTARARTRFEEGFTIEASARRMAQLYERVAQTRRARGSGARRRNPMAVDAVEAHPVTPAPASAGRLQVGDRVRVKSPDEILATLDDRGRVDGLPFMAEMLAFAGGTFVVDAVVHRTCDTVKTSGTSGTTRGMERTVHLEGLRCDGSAHGGCQARCLLFWKEEWLEPVPVAPGETPVSLPSTAPAASADVPPVLAAATQAEGSTADEPVYSCQATELLAASRFVSPRKLKPWVDDIRSGNARLPTALASGAVLVFNKWQRLSTRLPRPLRIQDGRSWPSYQPTGDKRTYPPLDLQPGELVEVRSKAEIEATLNEKGELRGLRFAAEMLPYCGQRARVLARVDRIIDEKTGRMLRLRDCIILDRVWCEGTFRALCRRKIYTYWREAWLRRVDEPEAAA